MIALRRSTVLADARLRPRDEERLLYLAHLQALAPAVRADVGYDYVASANGADEGYAREHDHDVRVGADAEIELESAKTVDDVDRVFRRHLRAGDVPDYIAKDYWVTKTIRENGHELEILVAPDYFAVGTDDDPLRAGKTSHFFAQDVADEYDSILPSQKLLRFLEANADVKIPYVAVQKDGMADDSTAAVLVANDKTNAAFKKYGVTTTDGKLKVGYAKSYVTRPGLDGKYLAIYGGRWSEGGGLVQPTSGHAHTTGVIPGTPNYADTSQRITLVSRKAKLDGVDVDLRTDVFGSTDPKVWGLVSDDGRFDPVFPNAGASSLAQFSVPGASDLGSGGPLLGGATSRPKASVKDAPSGVSPAAVVLALAGAGLLVWKLAA